MLRVLKNPVYIGKLVQGKESTISYKVNKRFTKDENEWAVIEHSHEPIVAQEDFESVQRVLQMDTRRGPAKETVALFSGMVFCGECGASMVLKTVPAGGKRYVYYVCSAHKQNKSCSPHRIRDTDLEAVVLKSLQKQIRKVIDPNDFLRMTETEPLQTAEAQKVQEQLQKILTVSVPVVSTVWKYPLRYCCMAYLVAEGSSVRSVVSLLNLEDVPTP